MISAAKVGQDGQRGGWAAALGGQEADRSGRFGMMRFVDNKHVMRRRRLKNRPDLSGFPYLAGARGPLPGSMVQPGRTEWVGAAAGGGSVSGLGGVGYGEFGYFYVGVTAGRYNQGMRVCLCWLILGVLSLHAATPKSETVRGK